MLVQVNCVNKSPVFFIKRGQLMFVEGGKTRGLPYRGDLFFILSRSFLIGSWLLRKDNYWMVLKVYQAEVAWGGLFAANTRPWDYAPPRYVVFYDVTMCCSAAVQKCISELNNKRVIHSWTFEWTSKFESQQKNESKAQSADSSKAYIQPSTFIWQSWTLTLRTINQQKEI